MRPSIVRLRITGVATLAAFLVSIPQTSSRVLAQEKTVPPLVASSGLQLMVDEDNTAPTLRLVLPGQPQSDRSIVVLFPEHVTAVRHGEPDGRQLFRWESGTRGGRPAWRRADRSLEYQRDLRDSLRLVARATLVSDGVRVRYE